MLDELPKRLVVVVAGAGARGAYEAGALSVILPKLAPHGLQSTILLGTSAGAINVALWAARAAHGKSLEEVGDEVKKVWLTIDQDRVFKQPFSTLPRTISQYATGVATTAGRGAVETVSKPVEAIGRLVPAPIGSLFMHAAHAAGVAADYGGALVKPITQPVARTLAPLFSDITALLDTTPLVETAKKILATKAIRENVDSGAVLGVGVVATTSPMDGTGGRSKVFIHTTAPLPTPEADGSIDFIATPIQKEHVLASAAIPVAFPAIKVTAPKQAKGWYIDGGVRLNAPIEPAIALGATTLLVVSSHATAYPKSPATSDERPDVLDVGAQSLHSILADGMIEDLRTMRRINRMVEQAETKGVDLKSRSARRYRKIEIIGVSPKPGKLSSMAQEALAGLNAWQKSSYWLLSSLLTGAARGAGNNELLSYLLFHPSFFQKQFELGQHDAHEAWRDFESAKDR